MDLPSPLRRLAADQSGVLSRAQLTAAGMDPRQVRHAISGQWRLLLPGVVLLSRAMPTPHQRLVAALLDAGPRSRLAGPTAAALHGLPGVPPIAEQPVVHVLVPAPQISRTVQWVRIRRTYLNDERIVHRNGLRLCTAPRALVDTAAQADIRAARAMVIDAVQQRLVRGDDLAHWVRARESRGRARLNRAVGEAMAGSWSVPEADLRALVDTCPTLPEAWANPELRDSDGRLLTTPDLWLDDVALAVMVHSRRFHARGLDWEATVENDSDLSALRVVVVGVTPSSISRAPLAVLDRIQRAYDSARASGHRPAVTATPRYPALKTHPSTA